MCFAEKPLAEAATKKRPGFVQRNSRKNSNRQEGGIEKKKKKKEDARREINGARGSGGSIVFLVLEKKDVVLPLALAALF